MLNSTGTHALLRCPVLSEMSEHLTSEIRVYHFQSDDVDHIIRIIKETMPSRWSKCSIVLWPSKQIFLLINRKADEFQKCGIKRNL